MVDVSRHFSDEQTENSKMIRTLATNFNLSTKTCFQFIQNANKHSFFHHKIQRNLVRAISGNLPHQPVPKLDDTLNKYLRSVRPLLTDVSYKVTEKTAQNFQNESGPKLQKLLENRAACTENWLSEWWLKVAYLGYRASVVVNSNPGLYYPTQQFSSTDKWLTYAAKIVWASLQYKQMIDCGEIEPERVGKFPLDMGQYGRIFGTCRIPQRQVDDIQYNPLSNHIVVIHRNAFYSIRVYDEIQPPNILSEKEIFQQLKAIVNQKTITSEVPVGILTTLDRDQLAEAYERLIKNESNKKSIDCITKSIFALCLDKCVPCETDNNLNVASHQLIHGGGPQENSGNRWFDKTLQFVVNENGINGITYEHSPAEGQPIAILTDFIFKHLNATIQTNDFSKIELPNLRKYQQPQKLEFKLSKESQDDIKSAEQFAKNMADNLHMNILHYKGYGKNFIKQHKMSPDSFLQMAFQLAYYKLHSKPGAQYETGQQRMFLHGRTETIRSCSIESMAFAKRMCDGKATDAEKLKALREAVEGHKKYTVMAMTGYGVDRHLFGLKLIAKENGLPIDALYADEGFVKSTHFSVSTSQVASNGKSFMCYGPAVEDGYGLCYNPRNDDMFFAISSLHSGNETCSIKMGNALIDALESMQLLLQRTEFHAQSKL